MKSNCCAIFSCALLLLLAAFAAPAAAQNQQPKTVADFYLLLPAKYIQPLARVKNRKRLIKTLDVANGYLSLSGADVLNDWEGWAEVALFKKTNGDYIVGVVDGECATICYSGAEFLEYNNGKWIRVTAKVLPAITDRMILERYKKLLPNSTEYDEQNPPFINYELPRKGTTVVVNANEGGDTDTPLFELVWTGAKFEIKN